MLKYALYDYTPKRRQGRASFEMQDISRQILMFKDGRNCAKRWAARAMAASLRLMDLSDTIIVCVPASCQHTHTRRFKRFSKELCTMIGAMNGFDHIKVNGKREKAHIAKGSQHAIDNVEIDTDFFCGKKILIVDDIMTTGQTADNFARQMEKAGAYIRMVIFLAKTRKRIRNNYGS